MLDNRLGHAANEARRVASTFNQPQLTRQPSWLPSRRSVRALAGAAAAIALIAVGWSARGLLQGDESPITAQPEILISSDPHVVQAGTAELPAFGIPESSIEIPLQSITEYLPSDAAYIRSFVSSAETIVAIGQIDEGPHRVFLVIGPEVEAGADGSHSTCIIDTAGNSGSCHRGERGDTAPVFGRAGGWGTDEGLEFVVLRGMVPESTSIVIATTPQGTFWQMPRGGIAFFSLQVSPNDALEWQFLDSDGAILGTRDTRIRR